MSRISFDIPHIFAALSSNVPKSYLDDNWQSIIDTGNVSIRVIVLNDSYTVQIDDNFCFLCCILPTDIEITLPSTPDPGFGFFISAEPDVSGSPSGATATATILGSIEVGTVQPAQTNIVLPGNFIAANYSNVKGGLVVWDGADWHFFPLFFAAGGGGGGGGALYSTIAAVDPDALSVDITFPVELPTADYLPVLSPNWPTTANWINRTTEGFTITFTIAAPGSPEALCGVQVYT